MKEPELLPRDPRAERAMKRLAYLVLFLLGFLVVAPLLVTPGCANLPAIESMPPDQYAVALADVKDVSARAAASLLRHGKATENDLRNFAAAIELASIEDATTASLSLVGDILRKAGVDDADVLDGVALIDIALRHTVVVGQIGSPLGPNARGLLAAVAAAIRDAAKAEEHGSAESR